MQVLCHSECPHIVLSVLSGKIIEIERYFGKENKFVEYMGYKISYKSLVYAGSIMGKCALQHKMFILPDSRNVV
jgi:hypothetical protein